jgi:hypothetical protein
LSQQKKNENYFLSIFISFSTFTKNVEGTCVAKFDM